MDAELLEVTQHFGVVQADVNMSARAITLTLNRGPDPLSAGMVDQLRVWAKRNLKRDYPGFTIEDLTNGNRC
jgi:hypothetical protein